MAYSNIVKLGNRDVVLCACDGIADALYRGSRFSHDLGRTIPVNRWLCEQCLQNMEEMDDANVRAVKYQRLPHEVWELWYEKNAS